MELADPIATQISSKPSARAAAQGKVPGNWLPTQLSSHGSDPLYLGLAIILVRLARAIHTAKISV